MNFPFFVPKLQRLHTGDRKRAVALQSQWINIGRPLQPSERGLSRPEKHGIEDTNFNFGVSFDLRDHFEAVMASEATKSAFRGNMNIDTRAIEVPDNYSEVKFEI